MRRRRSMRNTEEQYKIQKIPSLWSKTCNQIFGCCTRRENWVFGLSGTICFLIIANWGIFSHRPASPFRLTLYRINIRCISNEQPYWHECVRLDLVRCCFCCVGLQSGVCFCFAVGWRCALGFWFVTFGYLLQEQHICTDHRCYTTHIQSILKKLTLR